MKVGTERHLAEGECVNCQHKLDAVTSVGDSEGGGPSPGDFTVCIQCGHLMAFGDGLELRNLTDAEMHEIAGDQRVIAIQTARAAYAERKT